MLLKATESDVLPRYRVDDLPEAVKRSRTASKNSKQEQANLAQRLAETSQAPQPVAIHPAAADHYARMVADLEANLPETARGNTEAARRTKDAVRGLIDRVLINPVSDERGAELDITVEGTLRDLLTERSKNARSGAVVAGGGLEPPTCGL